MRTSCDVAVLEKQLQALFDRESQSPEIQRTAPYLGSQYCEGKRVWFIGINPGKPDDRETDIQVAGRRKGILAFYRDSARTWNPHYKGCVWVAARYLNSACLKDCQNQCRRKRDSECILMRFSQTNARHDVPKDSPDMHSRNNFRIQRENHLKELELFDADLIVVQSRSKLAEPLRESIEQTHEWQEVAGQEYLRKIIWSGSERSDAYVALFVHPSARGNYRFSKLWESEILPTLDFLESNPSKA